jgi:hypothetical protein
MSRTRTWPTAAVAFLAVCAMHVTQARRSASAQQPNVAPDELTQAILRYAFRYDGGNVRLLVGRVPEDLGPNFYAPPGTRVLGSAVMGSGVLVLAKSSAAPESLRALYTRALEPRGWKPLEMTRRVGFVDAAVDLPLVLCREGAQLHVQHVRRIGEANDLFLNYRDGAGSCEQQRPVFRAAREPLLPTLYAPPGGRAQASRRCFSQTGSMTGSMRASATVAAGSMGTSTMETGTTVAADMSAEDVLRHYGRQLESDGWRPSADPGRSGTAGAWTRADGTGTTEVRLQVRETGLAGSRCYEVQMTVSTTPR